MTTTPEGEDAAPLDEDEILDLRQQLAQAQHEIEVLRAQLDEAIAPKPFA